MSEKFEDKPGWRDLPRKEGDPQHQVLHVEGKGCLVRTMIREGDLVLPASVVWIPGVRSRELAAAIEPPPKDDDE